MPRALSGMMTARRKLRVNHYPIPAGCTVSLSLLLILNITMKRLKCSCLVIAALYASATAFAEENVTNRLSLSARFAFNVSARFKGLNMFPSPVSTRKTPQGDGYNYDNGYVLTDGSGNFGGQTWYWGYDDSTRQISGNNILMSRSAVAGGASSVTIEDDPAYGAELAYNRLLGMKGSLRFG